MFTENSEFNGYLVSEKVSFESSPPPDDLIFKPLKNIADGAFVKSMDDYRRRYKMSMEEPERFWKKIAHEFYFEEKQAEAAPFVEYNFDLRKGPIYINWLKGAKTNICYNVLDRNIENGNGKNIAYYWEGNHPDDYSSITYEDLRKQVCKFANVLKSLGVKKGDRVAIYMPIILEAVVAMLACARIGAIHSVVFSGFSAESLAERILDAKASVLITADGTWRGDKFIYLQKISYEALKRCTGSDFEVEHCIIVQHLFRLSQTKKKDWTGSREKGRECDDNDEAPFSSHRDKYYSQLMEKELEDTCPPTWVDSEDPLFILYTSGSTGKPKAVVHSTTGYMLYAATTFKYVFDYHPGDIYWCTADLGWITGHTSVVYGPLANGATAVLFEGTPLYPDNSRLWAIVEKYKVTQFYTAPTAIRSLIKFGSDPIRKHDLSSLKILGTAGEPINPEAWLWYYREVGGSKCCIVDTYFQTELGAQVITPLPGATHTNPGSVTFPFFGVKPALLTDEGKLIEGPGEGNLVFKEPWPGIMRTMHNNHLRFEATYFSKFPGYYYTGDGAKRDSDGYLWITGRMDDMLNVSGHLLSTSQVESALTEHKSVSESAAVAIHHEVKGEALYCFVSLTHGSDFNANLIAELKDKVREKIGAFATPETIQLAPALPKTRSGKIMRRILKRIAAGDPNFGDVSTLDDESVIQLLLDSKPKS